MVQTIRKRWTAARKKDAVIRMMRGEPADEVSRDLGVETYRLEKWKDQALDSIEVGLRDRQGDPLADELDKAKKQMVSWPWKMSCLGRGYDANSL